MTAMFLKKTFACWFSGCRKVSCSAAKLWYEDFAEKKVRNLKIDAARLQTSLGMGINDTECNKLMPLPLIIL
jgi:hypothetical protein